MKRATRYHRGNRWDAEDSIQDLYLALIRVGNVELRTFPDSYIWSTLTYIIYDKFRKAQYVARMAQLMTQFEERFMCEGPEDAHVALSEYVHLIEGIKSRRAQEAVQLVALGYTGKEIAQLMNCSIDTVEIHLKKARRHIQDSIKGTWYVKLRPRRGERQEEGGKARLALLESQQRASSILQPR